MEAASIARVQAVYKGAVVTSAGEPKAAADEADCRLSKFQDRKTIPLDKPGSCQKQKFFSNITVVDMEQNMVVQFWAKEQAAG